MNPKKIGCRLRELRELAGLTQAQLAAKAGCHVISLNRIENDVINPKWDLVQRLANALNVSVADFVDPQKKT